jgi:hypothetical protein
MQSNPSVLTIFASGSGASSQATSGVVEHLSSWCVGNRYHNEGPGNLVKPIKKIDPVTKKDGGSYSKLEGNLGGKGTHENVQRSLAWIKSKCEKGSISTVNMCGFSRGAVTLIQLANAMYHEGYAKQGIKVNLFALDPVPGAINDFGGSQGYNVDGRAGIDYLAPIIENYHAVLMENHGGLSGMVMQCIQPQEMSQSVKTREYPLYGQHLDCAWGFKLNSAAKISYTLAYRFLTTHGTTFAHFATNEACDDKTLVEEYSRLRQIWISRHKNPNVGRGVAAFRSTVVNEMRRSSYFMNGHHFELFQSALPNLYKAYNTTHAISESDLGNETMGLLSTPIVLNQVRYLRDPDRLDEQEDFLIELHAKADEMQGVLGPLETALKQAPAYTKTNPPATETPIWTVQQWKDASYVTIGRRHEQVAEIDKLLGLYQSSQKVNALSAWRRLRPIAQQITSHLTTKKGSDRGPAVAQLGRQVVKALRSPPKQGKPG